MTIPTPYLLPRAPFTRSVDEHEPSGVGRLVLVAVILGLYLAALGV